MKLRDLIESLKSRFIEKFSVNPLLILFLEDFFPSEKILGFFGLRFLRNNENWKLRRGLRIHFWSVIVTAVILLVLTAINFVKCIKNPEKIVECIESCAWLGVFIFIPLQSSFLCYWKRDGINNILVRLERHFPHSSRDQLQYGVPRNYRYLVYINRMYSFVLVCAVAGFMFMPLVIYCYEQNISLPAPIYFPLDPLQLPMYPIFYVLQIWIVLVLSSVLMATDSLFYSLISLVSIEFEIAAQKIPKIDSEHNDDDACDKLQEIIDTYNELIIVTDELEEIFSLIQLVNIFFSISTMCVTVFFIFTPNIWHFMIRFTLGLPPLVIRLFSTCFYGEQLQSASSRVAVEAYNSAWYRRSLKYRKMILLTMLRTQEPQEITGWNFFIIGMPVFYWIMQTVHSYYSFLSFLYEENN